MLGMEGLITANIVGDGTIITNGISCLSRTLQIHVSVHLVVIFMAPNVHLQPTMYPRGLMRFRKSGQLLPAHTES